MKILNAKIASCGMEILKNFPQIRIILSYENNVNQNQQCLITFYKPVVLSDWTRKAKIIFMTKTKWIKTVSKFEIQTSSDSGRWTIPKYLCSLSELR